VERRLKGQPRRLGPDLNGRIACSDRRPSFQPLSFFHFTDRARHGTFAYRLVFGAIACLSRWFGTAIRTRQTQSQDLRVPCSPDICDLAPPDLARAIGRRAFTRARARNPGTPNPGVPRALTPSPIHSPWCLLLHFKAQARESECPGILADDPVQSHVRRRPQDVGRRCRPASGRGRLYNEQARH
jgi:hypothetical protein